jgi:hypothetical protein
VKPSISPFVKAVKDALIGSARLISSNSAGPFFAGAAAESADLVSEVVEAVSDDVLLLQA